LTSFSVDIVEFFQRESGRATSEKHEFSSVCFETLKIFSSCLAFHFSNGLEKRALAKCSGEYLYFLVAPNVSDVTQTFVRFFGNSCLSSSARLILLPFSNWFPTSYDGKSLRLSSYFSFSDLVAGYFFLRSSTTALSSQCHGLGNKLVALRYFAFQRRLLRTFERLLFFDQNVKCIFTFEGLYWERSLAQVASDRGILFYAVQRGLFFPWRLRSLLPNVPTKIFVSGEAVVAEVSRRVACECVAVGLPAISGKLTDDRPLQGSSNRSRSLIYLSQGAVKEDLLFFSTVVPICEELGLRWAWKPHPLISENRKLHPEADLVEGSINKLASSETLFIGFYSFGLIEAVRAGSPCISLCALGACSESEWLPFLDMPEDNTELKALIEKFVGGDRSVSVLLKSDINDWYVEWAETIFVDQLARHD